MHVLVFSPTFTWAIRFSLFSEVEIPAYIAAETIPVYSKNRDTPLLWDLSNKGMIFTMTDSITWSSGSLTSHEEVGCFSVLFPWWHHSTVSTVDDYKHCFHSFRRNCFIQPQFFWGALLVSTQVPRLNDIGSLLVLTDFASPHLQLRGILMRLPYFCQQLLVIKTIMALGDTNELHYIIRGRI